MKCSNCQQDTIDARAKLPLLVGLPFSCRNCRARYYTDPGDIGPRHFTLHAFVGGLMYMFIGWSIFLGAVWPLAGAIPAALIVLNRLPVSLYRGGKPGTRKERAIVLLNVIFIGIGFYFFFNMVQIGRVHEGLLKDSLKANPVVLDIVGPEAHIRSSRSNHTYFSGVSKAQHTFIVTGEHGTAELQVVSELLHDMEPPVLKVHEIWLVEENGRKQIGPRDNLERSMPTTPGPVDDKTMRLHYGGRSQVV